MPYRLTIEHQADNAVEQFQREFDDLLDAKRYAHNQVRGDIFWTVRENHLDGLAPEYACRIEALGDAVGKPLNAGASMGSSGDAASDSLFTKDGPREG